MNLAQKFIRLKKLHTFAADSGCLASVTASIFAWYDVKSWSTTVKLQALLEPASFMADAKIPKFIVALFYLNCRYIQFYLHRKMFHAKIGYYMPKDAGRLMSIFIELAYHQNT